MAKLSKAQQEVIEQAQKEIDYAREHDFLHWIAMAHGHDLDYDWDNHPNPYITNESVLKEAQEYIEKDIDGWWKRRYEDIKNGIVLTRCNSRTLVKLEKMGLIEILYDSNGSVYGIDSVRLLNY